MNKLVLLDSNSLINRAFYAIPPLSDNKGRLTHAVYGFVSMLVRIIKELSPTHLVAAFDLKGPTFRHQMYTEYKGTRKPMSDDLASQFPILKELLKAMNIAIVELEGYEADDIIGTLARKTPFDTVVVSGDRDTLQLVGDTTRVWYTRKGISNVEELDLISLKAMGFTPDGIVELKSLMGDASDNIPGVAGVGEKTAMSLLEQYGSLDGVYQNIDKITGKLKERLIEHKDMAYLSKQLATINDNAPIECGCENFIFKYPFSPSVRSMMIELGFKSLIPRLDFDESVEKVITEGEVIKVLTNEELKRMIDNISKCKLMALNIDRDIHIACDTSTEYIITPSDDLFGTFSYDQIINELKDTLNNPDVKKIAFDYKLIKHNLEGRINGLYQDLMLKAYVANSGIGFNSVKDLIDSYGMSGEMLAVQLIKINEDLENKLEESSTADLYYNIEMPLIEVLYDMEKTGFRVDKSVLDELYCRFTNQLNELTLAIYEYSGKEFNINSSRQLGEILFNNLNLPSLKKNKTGFSLSADVLIKMRNMHPVIDLILKYRHLSKLLSTYIEGIKSQISSDGRVHTIFKQANTTTGRLSSTEPNMQNIPIRDDIGREIRRMFVASAGNTLICADYSQIELRLLAHLSNDPKLIASYINGEDIHTRTASEILGVPMNAVSSDMRRKAKAVNFGIIYGISSFGLSENIEISVKAAKEYIDRYFKTYPYVREYMDKNIEIAKATGRIKTITGRCRSIPELLSPNFNIKSFGERAAMNMPLQGSAADIIKIAMIRVYKSLIRAGLKSKLILQIHDELVIDTVPEELVRVREILVDEMEGAVALKVPIIADVSIGYSLYEAK